MKKTFIECPECYSNLKTKDGEQGLFCDHCKIKWEGVTEKAVEEKTSLPLTLEEKMEIANLAELGIIL